MMTMMMIMMGIARSKSICWMHPVSRFLLIFYSVLLVLLVLVSQLPPQKHRGFVRNLELIQEELSERQLADDKSKQVVLLVVVVVVLLYVLLLLLLLVDNFSCIQIQIGWVGGTGI